MLCLVGVGSVAGFGVDSVATSGVGSTAGSSVGSLVGIAFKFFIANNLPLKLSRISFLVLNNNSKLFKKYFFQVFLYLFQNSLIQ